MYFKVFPQLHWCIGSVLEWEFGCTVTGWLWLAQAMLLSHDFSLTWSSIRSLWQEVFTKHYSHMLPHPVSVPVETLQLTSEAQECQVWLSGPASENAGSGCLMISLSGRLGRSPILFHLQQLAFRSQLLSELQQTDGLASSMKCFFGAVLYLISCSAQKNFWVFIEPLSTTGFITGSWVSAMVMTAGFV